MKTIKDYDELRDITTRLSALSGRVGRLASTEAKNGADFNTHKALNVAYKELDAIRMLFLSMIGERQFNKSSLIKTSLDIATPQSWKVYLRGRKE